MSDPKVSIWVGIDLSGESIEDILPTEVIERLEDRDYTKNYALKEDGLPFDEFSCSDEEVGFGIEVLKHDWNDGVAEINLTDLISPKKPTISCPRSRLSLPSGASH